MFIRLRELISCQLPEYGQYSYICKSTSRTICFEPIHVSSNYYDKFAQRKLLLSSDVELNPGSSDMDTVLRASLYEYS